MRRGLAAAALSLCLASPLRAQQPVDPPPAPGFMPRFDFRMSADALSNDDPRFGWDIHWAGDFDLVDYKHGRATFVGDYQSILGNEHQPFDPYQSNYLLEAMGSVRVGRTELFAVLNHVSRHYGDRPKDFGIAENSLGPRFLRTFGSDDRITVDVLGDWRKVIARAYVDYTWIGQLDAKLSRRVNPRLTLYAHGNANTFLVDKSVAGRDRQDGGRIEGGVKIHGNRRASVELFGGYERVVDAEPVDRIRRRWAFAGFRLLGS
jgi:hypothetical protein